VRSYLHDLMLARVSVATALFRIPPSTDPQRLEIQVEAHGDDVGANLQLASGPKVEATLIYLPAVS
jgi:hypothetical protein